MHVLTMIGLAFAAGIILTDRFLHPLPHWLAVVLYTLAIALILVGMILVRKTGGT